MSLSERIKRKRLDLGMTQRSLAKNSGVSYGGIQAYERGQIPKGDNLLKIARVLGCSMDWLMTGENFIGRPGEMPEVRQRNPSYLEVVKSGHLSIPLPDLDPETAVSIPKIEARLTPGTGSLTVGNQAIGYYFFRKDWLRSIGNPKDLVLLEVVGDSMKPTLEEGDSVMVDLARKSISGANIYAIGEGESILIKRVQPLVGGKAQIICDNRDLYAPQEWDLSQSPIPIIGQIVWFAKRLVK